MIEKVEEKRDSGNHVAARETLHILRRPSEFVLSNFCNYLPDSAEALIFLEK